MQSTALCLVAKYSVHLRAWLQGPQCIRVFKYTLLLLLLDTTGKQPDQLALDTADTHTTHHLA